MLVLDNDNSTFIDVDGTLINMVSYEKYCKNQLSNGIPYKYGDSQYRVIPMKQHVDFLKHCKNRGDFIVVWSQNGKEHAEKIVKLLDLENYVDVVMAKPARHVDDKEDVASIVGNRIFIKE